MDIRVRFLFMESDATMEGEKTQMFFYDEKI